MNTENIIKKESKLYVKVTDTINKLNSDGEFGDKYHFPDINSVYIRVSQLLGGEYNE